MYYQQKNCISKNIIELFHKENYEPLILSVMNSSKHIFPEDYEYVTVQSNGECDYLGKMSQDKYDAKLPFLPHQVEMLTDGIKHEPMIKEWLEEIMNEAAEFQPIKQREDTSYSVRYTKLFKVFEKAVSDDNIDESLIFFFPFPVVPTIPSPLLDITSNFLSHIFSELCKTYDFRQRSVFVIHPSLVKNLLALRNLKTREIEYLQFNDFEPYFSYSIDDIHIES